MPITLKHINISDSDSIKLDKVNYNFDQLVANGGGPAGPQGSIGQNGPQGTTGVQGFQGPQGDEGFQGPPGPVSENYWKQIIPDAYIDADRLVPIHTIVDLFAPVVNIGYIENDPQYGIKLPLDTLGKTPYQWNIYRRQYSISNLRFLNDTITSNGFDFRLAKLNGKDQMTFGFIDYTDSISAYEAAISRFRGSITSNPSLGFSDTEAAFIKDTVFNSPIVIKRRLIIENANAGTDKIAISEDNTGLVKFKSVQELGGTVPYGTIVSILPSVFLDNDNFINAEQVYPGNTAPLQISIGKGIGFYEGWYLCHGKDWTDGTTLGTYPVPMLGNFNYQIDDNPFTTDPSSQGSAPATPLTPITHITGGSDIDMTATSVPTLVYNVTSTVSTSNVNVDPGTGTTFKIKQLPQIIYLGRNDLYWQDPGTGQAPSVPLTILLDDLNPDPFEKLNPDPFPLATITNQPAGATYSILPTITTPNGYYWSTTPTVSDFINIPSYMTVQSVTLGPGTFPTTIQVGINVNPHPAASPNPSPATLGINTAAFISAASASMTLVRTNPANTTIIPSAPSSSITYNFATGYTFTLNCNANSGYIFANPNVGSITSISGGGTYTINSSSFTLGNTQITMSVTITGVPFGTTNLQYALTLPVIASAPGILSAGTTVPGGDYLSWFNGATGTFYNVNVQNATGATVYIWVGINQGGGSTPAPITSDLKVGTNTITAQAPGLPQGIIYFSPNSFTILNGTTLAAQWRMSPTSDTGNTVKLYWANSLSAPAASRQPINLI